MNDYFAYWGKADKGDAAAYHLLVWHSLDVAAVSDELLRQRDDWCSQWAALTNLEYCEARRLAVWLVGLHDIGKFAESFQYLKPDLREKFFAGRAVRCRSYSKRHDQLGYWLWDEKLWEKLDEALPAASSQSVIDLLDVWMLSVTGHHGAPPAVESSSIGSYFQPDDITAAVSFLHDWTELIRPPLTSLARCNCQAEAASWFLAGLAVLSDWLGSNRHFFEFVEGSRSLESYWKNTALPGARSAVKSAGIAVARLHGKIKYGGFELLYPNYQPTPLQSACNQLPLSTEPQLYIL